MKIRHIHNWDVTIEEAKSIQLQLQDKIVLHELHEPVELIAGADVSYSRKLKKCFASVLILKYPELEIIERAEAIADVHFPYVPGYLTFREAPVLLSAFEEITLVPDLVLFDGQGIAHPRHLGIAAHLGLFLGIPTIGCAKSRLIGEYDEVGFERGDYSALFRRNEVIGAVVRTRKNVKPIFVSPGFKITVDESLECALKTCLGYRIPEPVRQSHMTVTKMRVEYERQQKQ